MNSHEAQIRRKIYKAFKLGGYWPTRGRDATVCPRCGTRILPPIGRPDLLILHPVKPARVAEVKAVRGTSFPFSEISPEQRSWLTAWTDAGGTAYLVIGKLVSRKYIVYVVPWKAWLDMEKSSDRLSIPFDRNLMARSIGKTDIVTAFKDFEFSNKNYLE